MEKQIISEDICIVNDNSIEELFHTTLINDLISDHQLELIEEEIFISQSQDEFCTNDSETTREDGNAQLSDPAEMGDNELDSEISEIPVTSGENIQHRDPAT